MKTQRWCKMMKQRGTCSKVPTQHCVHKTTTKMFGLLKCLHKETVRTLLNIQLALQMPGLYLQKEDQLEIVFRATRDSKLTMGEHIWLWKKGYKVFKQADLIKECDISKPSISLNLSRFLLVALER